MIRRLLRSGCVLVLLPLGLAQEVPLHDYLGEPFPEIQQAEFLTSENARAIVARVTGVVGLHTSFELQERTDTQYVAALIDPEGRRSIAYNPEINLATDSDGWIVLGMFAHEIAHHLNLDLLRSESVDHHEVELKADFFAGRVLALLGATLQEAQLPLNVLPDPVTTSIRPAVIDRLRATEAGWLQGRSEAQ